MRFEANLQVTSDAHLAFVYLMIMEIASKLKGREFESKPGNFPHELLK